MSKWTKHSTELGNELGRNEQGRNQSRKTPRWVVVVAASVVVAGVAVGAYFRTPGDDETKASDNPSEAEVEVPVLQAAYDGCSSQKGGRPLTIGDEGRTLIIDTESEYGPMGGLLCVLADLGTSQAVMAQMQNTTSMMGVQNADDGDLHYQFSYHPDNGINMVITDSSED